MWKGSILDFWIFTFSILFLKLLKIGFWKRGYREIDSSPFCWKKLEIIWYHLLTYLFILPPLSFLSDRERSEWITETRHLFLQETCKSQLCKYHSNSLTAIPSFSLCLPYLFIYLIALSLTLFVNQTDKEEWCYLLLKSSLVYLSP